MLVPRQSIGRRLLVAFVGFVAVTLLPQAAVATREQYLFDVTQQGYIDGRLQPIGRMSAEDIAIWTAAIDE